MPLSPFVPGSSTQSPSISALSPIDLSEYVVTSPSSTASSAAELLPVTPRVSRGPKRRRAIVVRTPGSVSLTETSDSESDTDKMVETLKETQHTEPKWLENLTSNFYEKIIEQCSGKTRIAVDNNEDIKVCYFGIF